MTYYASIPHKEPGQGEVIVQRPIPDADAEVRATFIAHERQPERVYLCLDIFSRREANAVEAPGFYDVCEGTFHVPLTSRGIGAVLAAITDAYAQAYGQGLIPMLDGSGTAEVVTFRDGPR